VLCIDDLKHALEILLLYVVVIQQEYDVSGLVFLSEVAQVHESVLCERSKTSVTKPHIERGFDFV